MLPFPWVAGVLLGNGNNTAGRPAADSTVAIVQSGWEYSLARNNSRNINLTMVGS